MQSFLRALAFTPLVCPLSTVNFLKSELNRPWKGGTDGYILGGNYQPLPPNTHKKRNKWRCCRQVNWCRWHVRGLTGSELKPTYRRGPSGAQTARWQCQRSSTAIRGWFLASVHISQKEIYIKTPLLSPRKSSVPYILHLRCWFGSVSHFVSLKFLRSIVTEL